MLVNCTSTGQSKGIELAPGSNVLNGISKYFNDEVSVHDLAAILLENICPGGGLGCIRRYTAAIGQPDPTFMAFNVLAEWCDLSPEKVFGGERGC